MYTRTVDVIFFENRAGSLSLFGKLKRACVPLRSNTALITTKAFPNYDADVMRDSDKFTRF